MIHPTILYTVYERASIIPLAQVLNLSSIKAYILKDTVILKETSN